MAHRGRGFFAVVHRWRRLILPILALFLFLWLISRSNELNAPNEAIPTGVALSTVMVSSPTGTALPATTAVSALATLPLPTASATETETPQPSPTHTATRLPTETPTIIPAPTETPSRTPTPDNSRATAVFNSSIFVDHDADSEELGIVREGESIRVLGRSPVGQWFFVESDEGVRGFTYSERYLWNGRFEELPVVEE